MLKPLPSHLALNKFFSRSFTLNFVIRGLLCIVEMEDFDVLSVGERTNSGIRSAGFLDRVLDGRVTLNNASSTETWKM